MNWFASTAPAVLLFLGIILSSLTTSAIAAPNAPISLIERYQRALAIDVHNPTLQYQLGVALLVEGNPEKAIEKFQRAYPTYTDSVEMNYNFGLAYFKVNDPDSAVLYFEQAEALGALEQPVRYPLENAYFNLGLTYLKNDLHLEAEQLLRKVLTINPDRIQAHHALGKLYTLTGLKDQAIAEYEFYLAAKPSDQPVRDFLFATYYNSGLKKFGENDYIEAREDFAKALQLAPNDARVRYTLAHSDMLQGDPAAAIDKLYSIYPQAEPALRQNIRVVIFNSALALLKRKQGDDLKTAEQAINTLLEDAPEDKKILFLAGNIALADKRYDQARENYETLLDIDPGHEGALINLSIARKGAVKELVAKGNHHLQAEDYLAALTALETALAIDPAVPDASGLAEQARSELNRETDQLFKQADQFLATGETKQALAFARKGLRNRPDDSRGKALEAKALGMLNAEIEENLTTGHNYLQQGELHLASLAFARVHELDAGNVVAQQGLEQINQQHQDTALGIVERAQASLGEGDLLAAEKDYREALELHPGQPEATEGLNRTLVQIDTTVASALRQAERAKKSGDFGAARIQLKKAQKLKPSTVIRQKLATLASDQQKQIVKLVNDAEKSISQEEFTAADHLYKQALQLNSTNVNARQGLVDLDKARAEAISKYRQKAEVALQSQDAATALANYRKILQLKPADSAALSGLQQGKHLASKNLTQHEETANTALKENRFNDAEDAYREVLALDPYHVEATAALERIGNARQSGLQAGDERKLYLEGIKLYTKGRYQDAITTWQKVLLLVPDHEKARMNIEKSQRKLRMIEERKNG